MSPPPSLPDPPAGTAASTAVQAATAAYLATLERASPSTRRQRAWALSELAAHAPALLGAATSTSAAAPSSPGPLAAILTPEVIGAWIDVAAAGEPPTPPASLPGLRARAAAARALATHAETTGALPPGHADALRTLHLPTPTLAPGPDPHPVRRLLAAATPDARPLAVHPAVWTRFCAHAHLLALTGEREDVIATLPTTALPAGAASTHLDVRAGPTPTRWTLPAPARTALAGWLRDRGVLAAPLTGAEPTALWLRARPSTDHRTGALRPAGLPVSDRGLRLAFTTTVAVLALADPSLREVSPAAVRNYARGRPR